MTPYPLLNWAVITVSFFNTIALIWLGLTVLLNAERPRWGTWVVGGGLLLGGAFFTLHTAAAGRGMIISDRELRIWLRLIWLPFVGGPYLWYMVMAWYSGALASRREQLRVAAAGVLGIMAVALPLFIDPNPSYQQLRGLPGPPIVSLVGIPAALLIYPVYSVICISRAIAALRHPGETDRFMGDLARQRARPWLLASSGALLAVTFAAGLSAAWLLFGISRGALDVLSQEALIALYLLDLLVSSLIAVAVVLMGMAIVAYEIFTGKRLPRGGLFRYWRNSLLLAGGYGAVLAASLELPVPSIYRLMLATLLMTLFYALLSWRSYADHERSMRRLRPFLASQHLYNQIVSPQPPDAADAAAPFRALCADLLDARSAALLPLGPLAPFVEPLSFPEQRPAPALAPDLVARLRQPDALCLPVEPAALDGAIWATPLWSERGLIGVLLLGPKRDGGLYTQEEIEVARAAGERMIDTRASAALAGRLLSLQRRRLAETQVIDQRTRRVLHDDLLPQLHAAMIMLQTGAAGAAEVTQLLAGAHRQVADLLHELPQPASAEIARLGLIAALRVTLVRELDGAFTELRWEVAPDVERRAAALPAPAAEVLYYAAREAARNAARYGRGGDAARPLTLTIAAAWAQPRDAAAEIALQILDDGVGLGAAQASAGGAGRGLALHGALLALVGGALEADRRAEGGTRVRLTLPVSEAG